MQGTFSSLWINRAEKAIFCILRQNRDRDREWEKREAKTIKTSIDTHWKFYGTPIDRRKITEKYVDIKSEDLMMAV